MFVLVVFGFVVLLAVFFIFFDCHLVNDVNEPAVDNVFGSEVPDDVVELELGSNFVVGRELELVQEEFQVFDVLFFRHVFEFPFDGFEVGDHGLGFSFEQN